MNRQALLLGALVVCFTANFGAQAVPPIYQGMYNQCRSDCMQVVEKGNLRGAPSPQASFDHRAGFCRFVCSCAFERLNANVKLWAGPLRGDYRELTAVEIACIAKYTPPADGTTKLRNQEISQAFREFAWSNANPSERRSVKGHFDEMRLAVAPVLSCAYGTTGISFWYEKVTIPSAQLRAIARSHPLLFLGDGALSKCPATLEEAEAKRREFRGIR